MSFLLRAVRGADCAVHVVPDERDELVRQVRGERGHRHQHNVGDGVADREGRAEYGAQILVTLPQKLSWSHFLGLHDGYLEAGLEAAILSDLEAFLLEVGTGFIFVERQKRMVIDGKDFHLDLLLYHRPLKPLVAVELKIGEFDVNYEGQMKLYLKWLNRHQRHDGEEAHVGLILCAETSR